MDPVQRTRGYEDERWTVREVPGRPCNATLVSQLLSRRALVSMGFHRGTLRVLHVRLLPCISSIGLGLRDPHARTCWPGDCSMSVSSAVRCLLHEPLGSILGAT